MTLAVTWPAFRPSSASTRVWRGTWLPWKTRYGDALRAWPCLPPQRDVTAFLWDQVNTLGGDAERLQETHPQNASQILLKKDELVTNWEQIRTLAVERHARLNDSYR